MFRSWLAGFLLLAAASVVAAEGPLPPCGMDPRPAFAPPGERPAVAVWRAHDLDSVWPPPPCTGWSWRWRTTTRAIRVLRLPLLQPGEPRSLHFLKREADAVWRYHSLTRIGEGAARRLEGPEASLINRTIALYRQIAGLATDRDPPAAP